MHSVGHDILFLLKYYRLIDFNVNWWDIWIEDQIGFDKMKNFFDSENPTIFNVIETNNSVFFEDRNECGMTHPPIIFDEEIILEFKKKNSHIDFSKGSYYFIVEAYRFYYKTKMITMKTKKSKKNESKYVGNLRYFYSKYPEWLLC